MRRALEQDDGFRVEVAAGATEEALGRLAWLWLARPDGWSDELSGILAGIQEAAEAEKNDRLAKAHLADVERRLARTEREVNRLQDVNTGLAGEVARLRQEVTRLESEVGAARADRQRAEARSAEFQGMIARADKDAAGRDRRHEALRSELLNAREVIARLQSEVAEARLRAAEAAQREEDARGRSVEAQEELSGIRSQVAEAIGRAAGAVSQLAPSLSAAMDALGRSPSTSADPTPSPVTTPARRRSGPGRPVPLPPAIFDDSPEAVDFLVRVPGVHLIVDGYNVALSSWPGEGLPALRDRLVAALAELALRQRIEVHVVFDGAGEGGRVPPPQAARRLMTVSFSASNVEADDEILASVDRLDPAQAVIVATDDRAVRDAARVRRANVISVGQLLRGLGRRHTPLK
jgi:predicted RNA-binding protein with PIN domain